MDRNEELPAPNGGSPFERIRRTNASGAEYWPSREFSQVLGYTDYRNFEQVIKKAKTACFNSGHRIEDHFVDITEMIEIGSGAQRPLKAILRFRCRLPMEKSPHPRSLLWHGVKSGIYYHRTGHGL
jgi:DNA-damage-inducible protein D